MENQEPKININKVKINVELTLEEVQSVILLLAQLPYNKVAGTINYLEVSLRNKVEELQEQANAGIIPDGATLINAETTNGVEAPEVKEMKSEIKKDVPVKPANVKDISNKGSKKKK